VVALKRREIHTSMNVEGRWHDNLFVEQLWRTIKYEEAYLIAYATVSEAKTSLENEIQFYINHHLTRTRTNRRPMNIIMQPCLS
jgi:putative transposase